MANQKVNNNIDITNIKRKIVGNFSFRQLVFIGIAVIIAFIVFFFIGRKISYKLSAVILAILLPPLFVVCENDVQNMPLEKYVWYKLKFYFLPQQRQRCSKSSKLKGEKNGSKKQKK